MSERRLHRPRRLNSNINVVPYIDVMLVLLVIFMVTSPLVSPSTVDLPQVGQSSSNPLSAVEIVIQSDGQLQLIDRDPTRFLQQNTTLNGVAALARSRMQAGENRPVVISADKKVVYNDVLMVMDILKTAGIQRVGLSVTPKTSL
jgi:biopolymer transport protein TolR